MSQNSNEAIRHLIRLANDSTLDSQSRSAICAMAEHVKNLQEVSQKIRKLDQQLEEFRCREKSSS
jgi:hypothetical protein